MNTRIGIRIQDEAREQIQNAISQGKAKNLSDFVRQAVREKLAGMGIPKENEKHE